MKGIKECINWMLDNPMRELESTYNDVLRRYNDKLLQFEWYDISYEKWFQSKEFCQFSNQDWQPHNPPLEFHEAYMDCLENGTEYLNEQGDISLTREGGKVAL